MIALALAFQSATAFVPRASAGRVATSMAFFGTKADSKYPVMAEETVMSPKNHGTSEKPVQEKLRWNCDFETADRICNFNRYAEKGETCKIDFLVWTLTL